MQVFQKARKLIANDRVLEALKIVQESIDNPDDLTVITILSREIHEFVNYSTMGLAPGRDQLNRAIYQLLNLMTSIESRSKSSLKLKQLNTYEKEISRILSERAKLQEVLSPETSTLRYLKSSYSDVYNHLRTRLTSFDMVCNQIRNNPEDKSSLLLSDSLSNEIHHVKSLVKQLVPSDSKTNDEIATLFNVPNRKLHRLIEINEHRAANLSLLDKRFQDLEKKYIRLQTAGVVGIAVFSLLGRIDTGSVYGKDYDGDGYDSSGRDFYSNSRIKDTNINQDYNELHTQDHRDSDDIYENDGLDDIILD